MPEQNFANHAQRVPGFIATGLILALTFIGACVNLYQSLGDHQRLYSAALIVVLTAAMISVAAFCRVFALKAQDRAIRAEENLRHYVMTGKLLDTRLTMRQIIALRFASDAEFLDLVRQAADKGTDPVEIKKAVKHWRADFDRA